MDRFWEWTFELVLGRRITLFLIGDVVRVRLYLSQDAEVQTCMGRISDWRELLMRSVHVSHPTDVVLDGMAFRAEEAALILNCLELHVQGWRSLPHARGIGRIVYGPKKTRALIADASELMAEDTSGSFDEVLQFACRLWEGLLQVVMLPRHLHRKPGQAWQCTPLHSVQGSTSWGGNEPSKHDFMFLAATFSLCFVGGFRKQSTGGDLRCNALQLERAVMAAQRQWIDTSDPKRLDTEKVEILWPAPEDSTLQLLVIGEEIRSYMVDIYSLLGALASIGKAHSSDAKGLPDVLAMNDAVIPLSADMKLRLHDLLTSGC